MADPLLTLDLVWQHLSGLESFFPGLGASTSAQEAFLTEALLVAEGRMLAEARLTLRPTVVKTYPPAGAEYDTTEDPYPYHASDARAFGFLRLQRRPVQSVESVRYVFGANTRLIDWPLDWVRLDHKLGLLHLVPVPGVQAGILYLAQSGLALSLAGGLGQRYLPQLIAVDYTAGVADFATVPDYAWHRQMLVKLAVREAMLAMGKSFRPGVVSESVSQEGLSQSQSYARGGGVLFQKELDQIEADWQRFCASVATRETPLPFTVL